MTSIAIVADYNAENPTHLATDSAFEHCAQAMNIELTKTWLPTQWLSEPGWEKKLDRFHALFIGPGSPYRSMVGALNAIRFGRESGRPLMGTCGGFQHIVIEFARNVLGFRDAQHAEYDPNASTLFVTCLPCSLVGKTLHIAVSAGSIAAGAYGSPQVEENYYCNFGLNPAHRQELEKAGLTTTGADEADGQTRIMELRGHRFFVGTLFVPQTRSTLQAPHPLVRAFLTAATETRR
jgi:CTP synthase (UTP-ammonia lyase)